jgi:hypothetical protein
VLLAASLLTLLTFFITLPAALSEHPVGAFTGGDVEPKTWLMMTVLHVLGFGFGIVGGALAIRRSMLSLVIVSAFLLMFAGFAGIAAFLGIFTFPLAIVGLILVVARRREFG